MFETKSRYTNYSRLIVVSLLCSQFTIYYRIFLFSKILCIILLRARETRRDTPFVELQLTSHTANNYC